MQSAFRERERQSGKFEIADVFGKLLHQFSVHWNLPSGFGFVCSDVGKNVDVDVELLLGTFSAITRLEELRCWLSGDNYVYCGHSINFSAILGCKNDF